MAANNDRIASCERDIEYLQDLCAQLVKNQELSASHRSTIEGRLGAAEESARSLGKSVDGLRSSAEAARTSATVDWTKIWVLVLSTATVVGGLGQYALSNTDDKVNAVAARVATESQETRVIEKTVAVTREIQKRILRQVDVLETRVGRVEVEAGSVKAKVDADSRQLDDLDRRGRRAP